MSFENNIKRRVLSGFAPCPLEIKERPELNVFPLDVLFMRYGTRDGKIITGTAIYDPDLETFKQEGEKCSMKYRNAYGGDCRLKIEYDAMKLAAGSIVPLGLWSLNASLTFPSNMIFYQ